MTTSQINDAIGRMGKNIRAARVARACGILSRTLRIQSKQKMWNYVVKPRFFCLFCVKTIKTHLVLREREGRSVKYLC